jgi:hypothetical protein
LKNNSEKIEAGAKKKDEGNVWFKAGKYARASKRYKKVTFLSTVKTTFCTCFALC